MFPALCGLLGLGLLVTLMAARQGRLEEELAGLRKETLIRLAARQGDSPRVSQPALAGAPGASFHNEPGLEPTPPPAEPPDRLGQLEKILKDQAEIVEQVQVRLAERERYEREIEAAIESTTVLSLESGGITLLVDPTRPDQNWRSTLRRSQRLKTWNATNAVELSTLLTVPNREVDHKSGVQLGEGRDSGR